jgi:hypothetical protein
MIESRNFQSGKRIATSLKVAVGLAVLSLIALTAEQPRLSAATARHALASHESAYGSDVGSPADFNGTASTRGDAASDASASDGPDATFPWALLAP